MHSNARIPAEKKWFRKYSICHVLLSSSVTCASIAIDDDHSHHDGRIISPSWYCQFLCNTCPSSVSLNGCHRSRIDHRFQDRVTTQCVNHATFEWRESVEWRGNHITRFSRLSIENLLIKNLLMKMLNNNINVIRYLPIFWIKIVLLLCQIELDTQLFDAVFQFKLQNDYVVVAIR